MQIRIGRFVWLAALFACNAWGQRELKFAHPGESGPVLSASRINAPEPSAAKLERAFWICDYVATTRGAHFTRAEACSAITAELKNEKFGGNYDEMVEWWRRNKPAEHLKLQLDE